LFLLNIERRRSNVQLRKDSRAGIEIGDVEALAAKYPDVGDDLREFQRG